MEGSACAYPVVDPSAPVVSGTPALGSRLGADRLAAHVAVSDLPPVPDKQPDTLVHRRLVVISVTVLHLYLQKIGFLDLRSHGFGLHTFANIIQPDLERTDLQHCDQRAFFAKRCSRSALDDEVSR